MLFWQAVTGEIKQQKHINKTASRTRDQLAKWTTASEAMMGNVEFHCPLSQHAQLHWLCKGSFFFHFLSFIFLPKRGQISDLPALAKPATGSWIYLAVFLFGGRFNEKPSPAVTPHPVKKRTVLVCFSRLTPPSMSHAAFQGREKKTNGKLFFFFFF